MAELTVDLFTTLDGYAYGERSEAYFGLPGPDLDSWIEAESSRPQVVLMGRVTYETMAAISRDATDPASLRLTETPKLVASTTRTEPLDWANSRLVGPDVLAAVAELRRSSADPVRTIGSLTLARGLIRAGLVDRLRLVVFPQVLGASGREPIFAGMPDVDLALVGTSLLDSRLVVLEYRPTAVRD
jgi:dihydrofolate reductase